MLQTANPTSPFKKRLKALLNDNKQIVSLSAMGFSKDWGKEKMWNDEK